MSNDFEVGDVVTLASGGPEMTVDSIDDLDEDEVKYTCIWFHEYQNGEYANAPSEATFSEDALELA